MAQVVVEKLVLLSGMWRPRGSVDDAFLRTVSQQFLAKSGAQASWRLTAEALTLVAQRTEGGGRQAQTEPIPVQSIKEVTVNRYNPLCLMTLYVDARRRFNALVCRCETEQDAAHIVQVFRRLQKSLSGEGYRIDLKQPQGINWTLKTKDTGHKEDGEELAGDLHHDQDHHDHKNANGEATPANTQHRPHHHHLNNNNNVGLVMEMEEEKLEREPLEVEGRHYFNVGVQADLVAEDDNVSMMSEMSYQSLKDELETLSNEVRDIKILLQQTTGISAEEFFRRRQDPHAPLLVPVKRHLSEDGEGGKSGNGEKSVNFAPLSAPGQEEEMDFDIRSVGMQTETDSKRGKYLKRVRNVLTPSRYQQRSRSDGSSLSSSGAMSPNSPFSPSRAQGDSVFFASPQAQDRGPASRDPRLFSHSLSKATVYTSGGGTVVRPIESVYHSHAPGFRQKRRQVVVLPSRSASMPRQFRPPSATHGPSSAGRRQAPKSPAESVPQNGTS